MEKAATDFYSFRVLRENGFTYVDKTAMTTFLTDALRKNPLDFSMIDIDAEKNDFAGKTVRKLGIFFSSEQRTIVDVKVA